MIKPVVTGTSKDRLAGELKIRGLPILDLTSLDPGADTIVNSLNKAKNYLAGVLPASRRIFISKIYRHSWTTNCSQR